MGAESSGGVRRPAGKAAASLVRRALRRAKHAAWLARHRLSFAAAHLPLFWLTERLHDEEFYREIDRSQEQAYDRLADELWRRVRPARVVDVGCGTGMLLAKLAEHGAEVRGIEGSRHALAVSTIPDRIVAANLERGVPELGGFDLCITIEVAQNLSPRHGRRFVAGLVRLADLVLFTSAQPGQGGRRHVNEQPPAYWEALFAEHGYRRSPLTDELGAALDGVPGPHWLVPNLLVFERVSP
jgi:SAM-dependent methyltransferase